MQLSKEDMTTLVWLRWHWEDAYAVNFDGETWSAIPAAAPSAVLTAESGGELRELMANDYAARAIRTGATAARWPSGNSGP